MSDSGSAVEQSPRSVAAATLSVVQTLRTRGVVVLADVRTAVDAVQRLRAVTETSRSLSPPIAASLYPVCIAVYNESRNVHRALERGELVVTDGAAQADVLALCLRHESCAALTAMCRAASPQHLLQVAHSWSRVGAAWELGGHHEFASRAFRQCLDILSEVGGPQGAARYVSSAADLAQLMDGALTCALGKARAEWRLFLDSEAGGNARSVPLGAAASSAAGLPADTRASRHAASDTLQSLASAAALLPFVEGAHEASTLAGLRSAAVAAASAAGASAVAQAAAVDIPAHIQQQQRVLLLTQLQQALSGRLQVLDGLRAGAAFFVDAGSSSAGVSGTASGGPGGTATGGPGGSSSPAGASLGDAGTWLQAAVDVARAGLGTASRWLTSESAAVPHDVISSLQGAGGGAGGGGSGTAAHSAAAATGLPAAEASAIATSPLGRLLCLPPLLLSLAHTRLEAAAPIADASVALSANLQASELGLRSAASTTASSGGTSKAASVAAALRAGDAGSGLSGGSFASRAAHPGVQLSAGASTAPPVAFGHGALGALSNGPGAAAAAQTSASLPTGSLLEQVELVERAVFEAVGAGPLPSLAHLLLCRTALLRGDIGRALTHAHALVDELAGRTSPGTGPGAGAGTGSGSHGTAGFFTGQASPAGGAGVAAFPLVLTACRAVAAATRCGVPALELYRAAAGALAAATVTVTSAAAQPQQSAIALKSALRLDLLAQLCVHGPAGSSPAFVPGPAGSSVTASSAASAPSPLAAAAAAQADALLSRVLEEHTTGAAPLASPQHVRLVRALLAHRCQTAVAARRWDEGRDWAARELALLSCSGSATAAAGTGAGGGADPVVCFSSSDDSSGAPASDSGSGAYQGATGMAVSPAVAALHKRKAALQLQIAVCESALGRHAAAVSAASASVALEDALPARFLLFRCNVLAMAAAVQTASSGAVGSISVSSAAGTGAGGSAAAAALEAAAIAQATAVATETALSRLLAHPLVSHPALLAAVEELMAVTAAPVPASHWQPTTGDEMSPYEKGTVSVTAAAANAVSGGAETDTAGGVGAGTSSSMTRQLAAAALPQANAACAAAVRMAVRVLCRILDERCGFTTSGSASSASASAMGMGLGTGTGTGMGIGAGSGSGSGSGALSSSRGRGLGYSGAGSAGDADGEAGGIPLLPLLQSLQGLLLLLDRDAPRGNMPQWQAAGSSTPADTEAHAAPPADADDNTITTAVCLSPASVGILARYHGAMVAQARNTRDSLTAAAVTPQTVAAQLRSRFGSRRADWDWAIMSTWDLAAVADAAAAAAADAADATATVAASASAAAGMPAPSATPTTVAAGAAAAAARELWRSMRAWADLHMSVWTTIPQGDEGRIASSIAAAGAEGGVSSASRSSSLCAHGAALCPRTMPLAAVAAGARGGPGTAQLRILQAVAAALGAARAAGAALEAVQVQPGQPSPSTVGTTACAPGGSKFASSASAPSHMPPLSAFPSPSLMSVPSLVLGVMDDVRAARGLARAALAQLRAAASTAASSSAITRSDAAYAAGAGAASATLVESSNATSRATAASGDLDITRIGTASATMVSSASGSTRLRTADAGFAWRAGTGRAFHDEGRGDTDDEDDCGNTDDADADADADGAPFCCVLDQLLRDAWTLLPLAPAAGAALGTAPAPCGSPAAVSRDAALVSAVLLPLIAATEAAAKVAAARFCAAVNTPAAGHGGQGARGMAAAGAAALAQLAAEAPATLLGLAQPARAATLALALSAPTPHSPGLHGLGAAATAAVALAVEAPLSPDHVLYLAQLARMLPQGVSTASVAPASAGTGAAAAAAAGAAATQHPALAQAPAAAHHAELTPSALEAACIGSAVDAHTSLRHAASLAQELALFFACLVGTVVFGGSATAASASVFASESTAGAMALEDRDDFAAKVDGGAAHRLSTGTSTSSAAAAKATGHASAEAAARAAVDALHELAEHLPAKWWSPRLQTLVHAASAAATESAAASALAGASVTAVRAAESDAAIDSLFGVAMPQPAATSTSGHPLAASGGAQVQASGRSASGGITIPAAVITLASIDRVDFPACAALCRQLLQLAPSRAECLPVLDRIASLVQASLATAASVNMQVQALGEAADPRVDADSTTLTTAATAATTASAAASPSSPQQLQRALLASAVFPSDELDYAGALAWNHGVALFRSGLLDRADAFMAWTKRMLPPLRALLAAEAPAWQEALGCSGPVSAGAPMSASGASGVPGGIATASSVCLSSADAIAAQYERLSALRTQQQRQLASAAAETALKATPLSQAGAHAQTAAQAQAQAVASSRLAVTTTAQAAQQTVYSAAAVASHAAGVHTPGSTAGVSRDVVAAVLAGLSASHAASTSSTGQSAIAACTAASSAVAAAATAATGTLAAVLAPGPVAAPLISTGSTEAEAAATAVGSAAAGSVTASAAAASMAVDGATYAVAIPSGSVPLPGAAGAGAGAAAAASSGTTAMQMSSTEPPGAASRSSVAIASRTMLEDSAPLTERGHAQPEKGSAPQTEKLLGQGRTDEEERLLGQGREDEQERPENTAVSAAGGHVSASEVCAKAASTMHSGSDKGAASGTSAAMAQDSQSEA